jgi:hypothetical protein
MYIHTSSCDLVSVRSRIQDLPNKIEKFRVRVWMHGMYWLLILAWQHGINLFLCLFITQHQPNIDISQNIKAEMKSAVYFYYFWTLHSYSCQKSGLVSQVWIWFWSRGLAGRYYLTIGAHQAPLDSELGSIGSGMFLLGLLRCRPSPSQLTPLILLLNLCNLGHGSREPATDQEKGRCKSYSLLLNSKEPCDVKSKYGIFNATTLKINDFNSIFTISQQLLNVLWVFICKMLWMFRYGMGESICVRSGWHLAQCTI